MEQPTTTRAVKAIALISGGLDSLLATKVILDQGVDVEGVNFFTGFCVEGHTHAIRKHQREKIKRNNSLWVAEQLGIKLHIVDVVQEYKDIVLNPKYGYGKNLNPCLDCKIFMVERALNMVGFDGRTFDFAISGEVIGQRPKSQRRETMAIISRESGANDRLLRPLCAKNLPSTLPEREGWVNREALHDFSGRSRKPQMTLAAEYGFTDYAQPAGGCCFLTDQNYSSKLSDLWNTRGQRDYELDDIVLLKVGRHLRPNHRFKLILAREEGENNFLKGYRQQYIQIDIASHTGPLALIDGDPNEDDLRIASRIVARYSQGRNESNVCARVRFPDGDEKSMSIQPYSAHEIPEHWHIGV